MNCKPGFALLITSKWENVIRYVMEISLKMTLISQSRTYQIFSAYKIGKKVDGKPPLSPSEQMEMQEAEQISREAWKWFGKRPNRCESTYNAQMHKADSYHVSRHRLNLAMTSLKRIPASGSVLVMVPSSVDTVGASHMTQENHSEASRNQVENKRCHLISLLIIDSIQTPKGTEMNGEHLWH